MIYREKTRSVQVGSVQIGGQNKVVLQTMTNTLTTDVAATIEQIKKLSAAGAELVRVSIPDQASLKVLPDLIALSPVPLVGDIHFNAKIALGALKAGIAKIRINPGNLGGPEKLREIARMAKEMKAAIRIGVNTGSIGRTKDRIGTSLQLTRDYIEICEEVGFHQLVLSLKSSDLPTTITLNEAIAREFDYPLHLGVTEAGIGQDAVIASAIGIGSLLLKGLGDTMRVSLPGDPVKELPVARSILRSVGLGKGVRVIACPTCSRTEYDVETIARQVQEAVAGFQQNLHIAVMGCLVNGPGEASEADFGVCANRLTATLYAQGQPVKEVAKDLIITELKKLLKGA